MCKNTFELYTKAVKAKYEIEKEGNYSDILNPPTSAKLRKLCIERFKSNTNKDDLEVFLSFFEFEFDGKKKNLIQGKDLDKLKSIRKFFLGITELPTEDTVHFAAILLDYQPRPFNKFKKNIEGKVNNDESEEINEPDRPWDLEPDNDEREEINVPVKSKLINLFISFKGKIKDSDSKNLMLKIVCFAAILAVGFAISYYVFPKEQCMQWSEDHYEKVDCDFKADVTEKVERFDESKFGLKKIKVCDTTTCFINGNAIVWYAKTSSDKADFFNTHGRHPENDKPLRPVTKYIVDKYGDKLNVLKK